MGVGIGVLAQPQLAVRFMTVKDDRSLKRAVAVGGPFLLMMTGVAFVVGALSNVYFYRTAGKIALQVVPGGNTDLIIPEYLNQAMPEIFVVNLHAQPAFSSNVYCSRPVPHNGYSHRIRCLPAEPHER